MASDIVATGSAASAGEPAEVWLGADDGGDANHESVSGSGLSWWSWLTGGASKGRLRRRTRFDDFRALPPDWTNPLTNATLREFDRVSPALAEMGLTPNMLSLLGGVLGLLALCALWYDRLALFALLGALSYLTDDLDGHMARTHGLTSDMGEALDHWKDVLLTVLLIAVILLRFAGRVRWVLLATVLVLYGVTLVFGEGCEIRARETRKVDLGVSSPDNSLEFLAQLCPPGVPVRTSRFLSSATFVYGLSVVMIAYAVFRHAHKAT